MKGNLPLLPVLFILFFNYFPNQKEGRKSRKPETWFSKETKEREREDETRDWFISDFRVQKQRREKDWRERERAESRVGNRYIYFQGPFGCRIFCIWIKLMVLITVLLLLHAIVICHLPSLSSLSLTLQIL